MESESAKKPVKLNLSVLITSVIFLAIGIGVVILVTDLEGTRLLGYLIFMVVIFALAILNLRFKAIGETIDRLFGAYLRFVAWMIITFMPLYFFNWISQIILTRLSLIFQLLVFAVWGVMLTFGIRAIATERSRERLFGSQDDEAGGSRRLGHISPVVYAFDLAIIAMMFFSSITFVLVERGAFQLAGTAGTTPTYDGIMAFYLWHFLESVPLLKVTETLKWNQPLTYESGWVGAVLLLFKIVVIVPVIAAFTWYWKRVSEDPERSK